ncbi:hypothetical protein ACEQ8H_006721 [Pleosporales sp. CAS-2024a]
MEQVQLYDVDIGTGHTFVHYFYTGLYEGINNESEYTMLTTSIKLRQALSVYLATIKYDIPNLNELAVSEMEKHASRLDLVEFLGAIGEGFQSLGTESWVHGYLAQKAKAAFEEDHTVFTSEAFLETLDNSKVSKFMMRCIAECYDNKILIMGSKEKQMSETMNDCQQSLGVLSQTKVVPDQNTADQHQLVIPLAGESTISECHGTGTMLDDLLSNEDFCTISASSEFSIEPQGCLEELTSCSTELNEDEQNSNRFSVEAGPTGAVSLEQPPLSTTPIPGFSIKASDGPTGGPVANQCTGELKQSHSGFEVQALEDSTSAQFILNEKEIKRQKKKMRKKERREMIKLCEKMKRICLEAAQNGNHVTESLAQPDSQGEVHNGQTRHAGGEADERFANLVAAFMAVLNSGEFK